MRRISFVLNLFSEAANPSGEWSIWGIELNSGCLFWLKSLINKDFTTKPTKTSILKNFANFV